MSFNDLLIRNKKEKFINNHFIENKDKKINLNDKDKMESLYVVFNDFIFSLSKINKFYNNKFNNNSTEWLEVLPSIYFLKEKSYLYIFNRNVRDTFYILNRRDSSKYIPDNIDHVIYDTNINPKDLPYPDTIGGECPIQDLFSYTKLYYNTSYYSILKCNDFLEITENDARFNKNYCRCNNNLLKALLEGKFKFYNDDKIQITKFNECYDLIEGKHRICAIKRYNMLNKIEVEVSHFKCNLNSFPYDEDKTDDTVFYKILKAYYNCYKKIGLNEKEARYITENITNAEFIKYFEKKYGKDIFQIINDLKD